MGRKHAQGDLCSHKAVVTPLPSRLQYWAYTGGQHQHALQCERTHLSPQAMLTRPVSKPSVRRASEHNRSQTSLNPHII
jgi:hypothetical protein